jgi:hypothetical protein
MLFPVWHWNNLRGRDLVCEGVQIGKRKQGWCPKEDSNLHSLARTRS